TYLSGAFERVAVMLSVAKSHKSGQTSRSAGPSAPAEENRSRSGTGGHDRNTAPEYFGSMGVAHGPLRRRHSGKGRAVPEPLPVDPSFFVLLGSSQIYGRCARRGDMISTKLQGQ